jgi:hypothetical protein
MDNLDLWRRSATKVERIALHRTSFQGYHTPDCGNVIVLKSERSWASVYVSGSDHLVREKNESKRARIASMRCAYDSILEVGHFRVWHEPDKPGRYDDVCC